MDFFVTPCFTHAKANVGFDAKGKRVRSRLPRPTVESGREVRLDAVDIRISCAFVDGESDQLLYVLQYGFEVGEGFMGGRWLLLVARRRLLIPFLIQIS